MPRRRTRSPLSTTAAGRRAERGARLRYRLRGYRVLASNVRGGGNEIDLVVRRGRRLVFVEVKSKSGNRFGDPLEMVDERKQRRIRRVAATWLARNPALASLDVSFEVAAFRSGRFERVPHAF